MGTRSLTFVYNETSEALINLYRQYDGYPSGHGAELAQFLSLKKIVNGFNKDTGDLANGMECLAAQIVAYFKVGCGQFYLYPIDSTDCSQDYEYHVYPTKVIVKRHDQHILFNGDWESFLEFCSEPEVA